MAARFRIRKRRTRYWTVPALGVAALSAWWTWAWVGTGPSAPDDRAILPPPVLTTDRPEVPEPLPPQRDIPEKGAESPVPLVASAPTTPAPSPSSPSPDSGIKSTSAVGTTANRAASLVSAGKQSLSNGDVLAARTHFSDAMQHGVPPAEAATLRAELTRLGQESIFSPRILDGDPFVSRYVIQPGDNLAKIAAAYMVPADLLAYINNIANKNLIRAGQTIKVIKGPFHATVRKSDYTLDLYLDKTFVKHFRVGLGADNSTPTGVWQVSTKLVNPTYYPPRGGQIISADDPENPLGEHWIGLVGVSGEAVGQQRYGIHGTNEPHSIGRSVSLGCVRLYNEDVEFLYKCLIEKHSTVTVVD